MTLAEGDGAGDVVLTAGASVFAPPQPENPAAETTSKEAATTCTRDGMQRLISIAARGDS